MSRTRRIITSCLHGRRGQSAEGGFSLIEVLIALSLLITVMATTAGFFTTSLKQSNGQTQAQEAAALAEQQLDYTRSVAATSLVTGRTSTQVQAAVASPGLVDLSQDVTASPWPVDSLGNSVPNYDPSAISTSTQAVPISMTQNVGGTAYTVTTFINPCYVGIAATQTCTTTNSGNGYVYRISVDVAYKLGGGRSCGASSCQYVASTLRDPGTDACFNVNPNYAGCSTSQPTITQINPSTVTTNSTTTVTLTGTNFDPGATVSLLAGGTAGTVSNVTRISSTSLTFTLLSGNTPASVGIQTVQLTNPNGKFAYGTFTITTTAINVTTITPSPINTSTTVTMTINGSGFQSGSVVSIPATAGTIVGTPTIAPTAITLNFTAGSSASAIGTWVATVTNPDGNSDTGTFVIQKAPITVTAISPATMNWGNTRTFTITGTGFNSGAQVTLDGAAVTEVWNSSTSMTVTLTVDPAVGTRTFAVTNPDGGTASKTFTVTVNAITVTTVTPATLAYGATRSFTIAGTGFNSGAQVTLDGAAVTEVWNSSTSLTVSLTSDPLPGSHTFTVTNPDGGFASKTFTVTMVITNVVATSPAPPVTHNVLTTFTITGHFAGVLTGSSVILTGTAASTITPTTFSATSITFKYNPTTKKTYNEGVQFKASDGTVSNVYAWTLVAN